MVTEFCQIFDVEKAFFASHVRRNYCGNGVEDAANGNVVANR